MYLYVFHFKNEHQTELHTDEQHQIKTKNTGTAIYSRYVCVKLQNETSLWIAVNQFAGHGQSNQSFHKACMENAFYILFLQFNTIFELQNKNPTSFMENGHWQFCVTKVGMDVVPNPIMISMKITMVVYKIWIVLVKYLTPPLPVGRLPNFLLNDSRSEM